MASNEYINRYLVNCGGVNNTLPDELIADNELSDSSNIVPGEQGQQNLVKRAGYAQHLAGTASQTVYSLYSGIRNRFYATYNTGTATDFCIYDLDAAAAALYSHTDPITNYHWASFNANDYFVGGTADSQLITATDTTFADWTGILDTIQIIEVYNNFMFGTLKGGRTLYWSAISDPATWPAANNLVFGLGPEKDWPTALQAHGDVLVMFTQRNFYHIFGTEELGMRITYSNKDVGCIGQHAALSTAHGLIWWSPMHGIVISRDGYKIETPMLDKIRKTWDTVVDYQDSTIHGIWRPDFQCARFFVKSGAAATANLRIDYYPKGDRFFLQPLTNLTSPKASLVYINNTFGTSTISEYTTSGIKPMVENLASAQDDSNTLTDYMETKRQAGVAGPIAKKVTINVQLTTKVGTTGAVSVQIYRNNATSAETAITPTVAAGVDDTLIGINAEYNKIKFRIGDSLNERTEYYSLVEAGKITEVM